MTQVQGLPEPPDVHSQNVDISAQDGGVAAYQIGQLNNHISVDGLATLQELLQLNEDLKTPDGDSASQIKRHLSQQKPDMGVRELIALELRRMRTLPEFALDDYNNYDPDYAHALSERVIEAARLPVAVVAVMAFWGDPDTDRWWAADLERLSRIRRRGGSAWLQNLPLVAASMLFYAAGVASICAENYARMTKLFALHGEPINTSGAESLTRMLRPNPPMIMLTAARNYQAVGPTVAAALREDPDVIDEAWQFFEILRLATQLMDNDGFEESIGNYAAAIRRGNATASLDQTAPLQAEATKHRIIDELAAHCHPTGLHLLAVDKVYSPGSSFRWGSPIAERVAAEVSREGNQHALVSGLNTTSAERIEVALRAVSHAVGAAATRHSANWVSGVVPNEIWLDS